MYVYAVNTLNQPIIINGAHYNIPLIPLLIVQCVWTADLGFDEDNDVYDHEADCHQYPGDGETAAACGELIIVMKSNV